MFKAARLQLIPTRGLIQPVYQNAVKGPELQLIPTRGLIRKLTRISKAPDSCSSSPRGD